MYVNIVLVGNLGADPEMRYTPSGQPVTEFRLATNRRWTDRETNEQKKETTWYRVSVWGKQAESCNEYLRKGSMVLVEADRIKASAYIRKDDGQPAASLEVTARNVRFMGGGGRGEPGAEAPGDMPDDMDSLPF